MNMSIRLLVILFMLSALFFIACSTPGAPEETGLQASPPSESGEVADDPVQQTETISGILRGLTERTVTLECSDGVSRLFDYRFERNHRREGELVPGSLITIEYRGLLNDGKGMQQVSVAGITVKALPDEVLAMQAGGILETMSLSEKIGQLFLAHFPAYDAALCTLELQPGGYILFSEDFRDKMPEDVQEDILSCQQNAGIPLLISVDEEGGAVNRISRYPQFRDEPFPSPQSLFANGGWDAVVSDTREKAELLRSLGININLAPICDVSTDRADFIYKRSFGADSILTAEYVKNVVETMVSERLGCVLKHFPGYGGNSDTHTGTVYDKRPYEIFALGDFLPFIAGIEPGAGAVMVCHNNVECMDNAAPASLSAEVHRILREELNFDGVVITDDLNMQAVLNYAGDESAAVLALLAGSDMVCTPYFEEEAAAVAAAVENGTISEGRIEESVRRILIWKLWLGIIE